MIPTYTKHRSMALSYADVIAADSPIAWWRLQETSGPFADSTANPAPLDITGTPTLAQAGIPGAIDGKSVIFSSGNFAKNTSETKTKLTVFSVETWFFQKALNTAAVPLISSGYLSPVVQFLLTLGWSSFGNSINPQYQTYNSGWSGCSASTQPAINVWHHMAVTQSSSQAILYIDGAQVAVVNKSALSKSQIWLGTSYDNVISPSSPIKLAEPAVYDKVLTSAQVLAHYNAGR